MVSETAIPTLETRIFRGYWQDGALDISAGLALTFAAILWLLGAKVGIAIAPAIGLAAFPILRKRITEPRIGHVRFNETRRTKLRRAQMSALVGGAAALVGVYALALLACAAAVIVTDGHPAAAELAGGAFITTSGAVLMRRLMRKDPIASGDME